MVVTASAVGEENAVAAVDGVIASEACCKYCPPHGASIAIDLTVPVTRSPSPAPKEEDASPAPPPEEEAIEAP